MAVVDLTVNGQEYQVACDDGQEDHLRGLAEYIDKRVAELANSMGQVGEARLILMAGLTIADELTESVQEAESAQSKLEDAKQEAAGEAQETIQEYASRIETIAARLESGAK
jgi:cell division protein ZapA